MKPTRRKSSGLTVIETLIAATLFLTAIIVIVGLYPASARAARQAQGHLIAVNLAEKELEFSRGTGFDYLENYSKTEDLVVENNGAKQTITFNTQVEVTDVRPGLKSVKVTVEYVARDNFTRQLIMETYVGSTTPTS